MGVNRGKFMWSLIIQVLISVYVLLLPLLVSNYVFSIFRADVFSVLKTDNGSLPSVTI